VMEATYTIKVEPSQSPGKGHRDIKRRPLADNQHPTVQRCQVLATTRRTLRACPRYPHKPDKYATRRSRTAGETCANQSDATLAWILQTRYDAGLRLAPRGLAQRDEQLGRSTGTGKRRSNSGGAVRGHWRSAYRMGEACGRSRRDLLDSSRSARDDAGRRARNTKLRRT